jgi:hypothetical protein
VTFVLKTDSKDVGKAAQKLALINKGNLNNKIKLISSTTISLSREKIIEQ